jgi:cobalt-zinc-cadmium efflux system membrane fusion protein
MKRTILYFVLAALVISGCGRSNNQASTASEASASSASSQADTSSMTDVHLTDAQVKDLGVTIGKIPEHKFSGLIEANGTLCVMPQSEASVSPYVGANVRSILVKEGQSVRRGQKLAYLSHPDLLDLQSRYLSAYNRMSYVSQEYNRQKELYSEKVGSEKDFQQIQSEYRSLQAEIRTGSAQLRMIGIDPSGVAAGKTVTSIAVYSPINGTVDRIDVKTGQYADSQIPMFHIVNTDNVYADLLVFEKDVPNVKVGQSVSLLLRSANGAQYEGKVYSVGKTFETNPKVVHVRASIDGPKSGLIIGMYLCGKIASDVASLEAVSEEGVVDEDGKSYIFSASKEKGGWCFSPIEVSRGRNEGGYVEIKGFDGQSLDIALDNAYYLLSEMKKGETGEE